MKKLALALAVTAATSANAAVTSLTPAAVTTASDFGSTSFALTNNTSNMQYDDSTGLVTWDGTLKGSSVAAGFEYSWTNASINVTTGEFTADFVCTDLNDPLAFGGSTCGGWIYGTTAYGGFDTSVQIDIAPAASMDLFQIDTVLYNAGPGLVLKNTSYTNWDPAWGDNYGQDYNFVFNTGGVTIAAPAAVPVPAAAWLFGSAIVGLAGIGRKRKA